MKHLPVILILLLSYSLTSARIIRVPTEYQTINAAINAAQDSDTILVQPGIYRGQVLIDNKDLLVTSNYLFSNDEEDIHSTIIDGGGNERGVRLVGGLTRAAILNGFTIRYGRSADGAGIYCAGSSPTLSHLLILSNRANEDGGGIAIVNRSHPLIIDCQIVDNLANDQGGGIYVNDQSNPELIDVHVSGNEASSGGGVYCNNDSKPNCESVEIIGNSALRMAGGLALLAGCEASLYRVAIVGNHSGSLYAGGVFIGATVMFENVTITGNTTDAQGGGAYFLGSIEPLFVNTVIWGNSPNQCYSRGRPERPAQIDVRYCDIENGEDGFVITGNTRLDWGDGNMNSDPRFVDFDNNDARLTEDSPCIDSGDPDSPPDPDDTRTDIGAYWYNAATIGDKYENRVIPARLRLISAYPNPFNSKVTLLLERVDFTSFNLSIHHLDGRLMDWRTISAGSGIDRIVLNAEAWPTGLYFARAQSRGDVSTLKMNLVR